MRSSAPPETSEKLPKLTWSAVARLLSLAAPYRKKLVLAGFLMIISTGITLSYPLLMRRVIEDFTNTQSTARLDQSVIIFLGLIFVSAVLGYSNFLITALAGNRIVMDLRVQVFSHLERLPAAYFDRARSGDLTSHLSNDVSQLQSSLTDDLVKFVSNILTLVGGITIVLFIDWRMTTIVVTLLFVTIMFFVVFGRRLRKLNREALDALADAMGSMTEALANVRLVKAFTRESYESDRAAAKLKTVYGLSMKSAAIEGVMGAVAGAGFALVLVGIVWYGARRVLDHSLTSGDLIAFFMAIMIISGPMGSLASLISRLQRSVGASDRIFAILDEAPELPDTPQAQAWPNGPGEIRFDQVSFFYVPESPVIRHLSLVLAAGKVTAIVGPSGSGKTTMSSLLYRFYEPQEGEIYVDGYAIDGIKRNSLRENIGVVPQEPILFNGTLRENIRYGRLDATDREIEAAAHDANVAEFVEGMPDRYETLIGERGITLSGGQRQRVAIARALLKNPKILILDEATSALDNKSEALVRDALDRLMEGRTTMVIAHRLSTVQNADQIAVLAEGAVAEIGTHAELLTTGGRYAELYRAPHEDRD